MASLVADYSSDSEGDSDNETEAPSETKGLKDTITNYFSAENEKSSDSDSDESDDDQTETQVAASKLPNPLDSSPLPSARSCMMSGPKESTSSVFRNPFQTAEEAKLSVLEQHVKLSNAPLVKEGQKKSKKVCISFQKKGKCRFGKKCNYSHSLDAVASNNKDVTDASGETNQQNSNSHNYYGQNSYYANIAQEEVDEDSYMDQAKRKFRVGINDTLKPPKKALKFLDRQRREERPWTAGD